MKRGPHRHALIRNIMGKAQRRLGFDYWLLRDGIRRLTVCFVIGFSESEYESPWTRTKYFITIDKVN